MAHIKLIIVVMVCLGLTAGASAQQAKWNELNQQVQKLFHQGKYAEGVPLAETGLEVATKTFGPNRPEVATALKNLALLKYAQAKYTEAEPLFQRSLAIRENALGKDHPDVGQSLHNLALLYYSQGKYAEAGPLYQRSLAIFEKVLGKDHPHVALSLNNLALLCSDRGQYGEAESLYQRSLAINEKVLGKDHPYLLIPLNNLAVLYKSLGKYALAESLFERSIAICENALGKEHPYVAPSLGGLGNLHRDQGNSAEALRRFQEYLRIMRKEGLPTDGPQNDIANVYLDEGKITKAEPIIIEEGWNQTRARLCLMKGDFAGAKEYYERVRRHAEENRNADSRFLAYAGLGMAFENLQDDVRAADQYCKAIELTEELRTSLKRSDRENFLDAKIYGFSRIAPYGGFVRVLLRMNKPLDALKGSEYSKARVFAERISDHPQAVRMDVPADVVRQDQSIIDQLAALKQAREEAYKQKSKERIAVLERQIAQLEEKLKAHVNMLRNKYPLFAAVKYPQPMDLAQTAVRSDEWVLEYCVTETGVAIFLVRGRELEKALFRPIQRKDLDTLVKSFRQPLEMDEIGPKNLARYDFAVGKRLSDILLVDVLADLPQGVPLIVVPDGSLGVIPFEMLVLNTGGQVRTDKAIPCVVGAKFFGDRNPISYYQSITALTLARTLGKQRKPGDKVLAIVDPIFAADDPRMIRMEREKRQKLLATLDNDRLMSIRNENGLEFTRLGDTSRLGKSLKKADPARTDLYEGLQARKSILLEKDLTSYRSIVFGTHGYYGKALAGIQEPVLVLTLVDQPKGQDGFLRLSEVMGLKMNCEVTALTACQSGLGKQISGEGTMGMGRAFQYAGAKSVLMSLWSVAQESSVDLVTSFFRHLREGKNKLEALKLAREEIRKAGYDHPFFWAPFILVGEMD